MPHFFPNCDLHLLFDVSHNTCKAEKHAVAGKQRELFVHRKGATRVFGPGHESLPEALRPFGQPVLIGGSMGTGSYILVGEAASEEKAFSSACHGAGRALSRHAALKRWSGRKIVDDLASEGILIRSPSNSRHRRGGPRCLQGRGCRGRGSRAYRPCPKGGTFPLICIKG